MSTSEDFTFTFILLEHKVILTEGLQQIIFLLLNTKLQKWMS